MEKELLLYSGGPDSTVLLKYFLQNKKNLLVLHIQMGWSLEFQHRIKFTKERVDQLVKYLKNTYGEFEFMDAGIFLNCHLDVKTCSLIGLFLLHHACQLASVPSSLFLNKK